MAEQRDQEQRQPEPQIPVPFLIAGFLINIVFDVISFFFPGAGDLMDVFAGIMNFFVVLAGVGGTAVIIVDILAMIGEAIPVVQALPLFTISWGFTAVVDRFLHLLPEWLQKKIKETAATAAIAKGGVQGVQGIAGGAEEAKAVEGAVAEGTEAAEEGVAGGGSALQNVEAVAEGTEAAEDAGESGPAKKKGLRERAEEAYDKLSSGQEGDSEESGEGGEEEEGIYGSAEQQQMMEELSGNYVGGIIKATMSAADILRSINRSAEDERELRRQQELKRRRDEHNRIPKVQPPGQEEYNSREVDLTN